MIRSAVRVAVERLLLASGVAHLSRARLGGRTLVLAYHNIVPDGEMAAGDRSLHLGQRRFAAQLDELLRTHEVVPLTAVLDPPTGASGKPRAAITFDDAYRGAITAGIDEVVRRGLPASVFVAPAFVGGATFWWDSFAGPDGLPVGFREHALATLRGRDAAVRGWAEESGHAEHPLPPHAYCATEAEIRAAAARPGITLGAHTWGHVNLAAIDPAEHTAELVRPLAWLRERFPSVVPWLSYPYGMSSPAVEHAAAAAGYRGAFRIEGGWVPAADADRYALPRLDVSSGLSLAGFRLRLAGLLG